MNPLLEEIRRYEAAARRLEPDAAGRRAIADPVREYAEQFLDTLHAKPAYRRPADSPVDADAFALSEEPAAVGEALAVVRDQVDRPGLNPASGGHLAYIPGGGIYPAALGDLLAAVTNRYAGVAFAGPGAVRMERALVEWMAAVTGFPGACGGDLSSGGSIANLIGIVSAREAAGLKAKDFHRAVVYLTSHAHHCIDKALRVVGMGEAVLRRVGVDDLYRMRPDDLEAKISGDRRSGNIPWMVVGSAGTTDTGAIDPMRPMAEIAAKYGLWFHIDGGYGAFFALCADGRRLLDGMERGDSLVLDPHKGLFLPYGTGAVLVRDRAALLRAHAFEAHYMQDAREGGGDDSPAGQSPELTRHFRGLRMWLPLKLFGVAPFRACLEEKRLLARWFHAEIGREPGWEVGPPPDLTVVTYRYLPASGDPDEFNRRLIEEVQKDGRVFLSSTRLDGRFTLRLAVLAFRTHLDTVETALDILRDRARYLERTA